MNAIVLFLFLSCMQAVSFEEQLKNGIGGTVNVPHYGGLADVAITLRNTSTNSQSQTLSDSKGKYFFECPDDGEYELTFKAKGFLTQKQELKYLYPGAYLVDVVMCIGDIGEEYIHSGEYLVVSVVDAETQKLIEGAEVIVDGSKNRTSKCGKTWHILPPGEYRLTIQKNGYREQNMVVTMQEKRKAMTVSLESKW